MKKFTGEWGVFVKQFICDCCEKVDGTHSGTKSPVGWGKGSFSIKPGSGYDTIVNFKADICGSCMKNLKEHSEDLWKSLVDALKNSKNKSK